jgi:hypothetical protein
LGVVNVELFGLVVFLVVEGVRCLRFVGTEFGLGVRAKGFLTSGVLHSLEIVVPFGNNVEEIFIWSGSTRTGITGVDFGVYGGMYFFFPGNSGMIAAATSEGLVGISPKQED